MITAFLFVLGLVFGSFLNVVALRYDPDKFLFSATRLGGRSHCPKCKKTLHWYELIPLLSFAFQRGKCRSCSERLSLIYPSGELLSGIIFAAVPSFVQKFYFSLSATSISWLSGLWIGVFWILLLAAFIDIRLQIIPDEAQLLLLALGIAIGALSLPAFSNASGSFMGPSALLFDGRANIYLNRLLGIGFGLVFFGGLFAFTRGRGMGMGDIKLAAVLGVLFGWPDIVLIVALGFIIGSLVGVGMLIGGRKKMKSALAFGPFLAASALIVFFFGSEIVAGYFSFFALR